jgi:hypothetical protein
MHPPFHPAEWSLWHTIEALGAELGQNAWALKLTSEHQAGLPVKAKPTSCSARAEGPVRRQLTLWAHASHHHATGAERSHCGSRAIM